jgi:short-subunit dehydrogenase involved in D-alanine esterification of teichoic acids
MKLEGKRILIADGSSGIGLELARLADRNQVVIAGMREYWHLQPGRHEPRPH